MESHTIQVLLDQARAELEAAERREREQETQLRILHSVTKDRRAQPCLGAGLGSAQVRNIQIRILNVYISSGSDPDPATATDWIELLRQNRLGVTDRTGDRMDSNRQDRT